MYDDLVEKSQNGKDQTIKLLQAFEQAYIGKEPDEILQKMEIATSTGESPEVLLKAYKWIWGQEDVNYPTGKGRAMSWEGWKKKNEEMVKTGTGLKDLLVKLQSE